MIFHHQHPFDSTLVPPRNVDVWLPPGYAQDSEQRYPVLYMHDGQNLFNPALSFSGVDWGIDPAIRRLMEDEEFRPPIVVGIWNTENRLGEYMPEMPMKDPRTYAKAERFCHKFIGDARFDISEDAYLAFIVEELKPWVDADFRTLAGQPHTYIAGSSMGGLISMDAICQYPEVFCGAGCVSTAWAFGQGSMITHFSHHLPDPVNHRLYFDLGGKETPSWLQNRKLLRKQARMDRVLRQAGYVDGETLLSLTFPEDKHHESAWRERVKGMIGFLVR